MKNTTLQVLLSCCLLLANQSQLSQFSLLRLMRPPHPFRYHHLSQKGEQPCPVSSGRSTLAPT